MNVIDSSHKPLMEKYTNFKLVCSLESKDFYGQCLPSSLDIPIYFLYIFLNDSYYKKNSVMRK